MAPVSTCRENSAMTTTLENRHKKSLLNSSWSGYGILCLEGLFGASRVLQPGVMGVAK